MLGLVRRAALAYRGASRRSVLGGEAVLKRLAAIGAANVRCCLPLMEAVGGARARLERLRHDLSDPTIALHRARTLKTMGAVEAAPIAAG
jgi:hypothetical protein